MTSTRMLRHFLLKTSNCAISSSSRKRKFTADLNDCVTILWLIGVVISRINATSATSSVSFRRQEQVCQMSTFEAHCPSGPVGEAMDSTGGSFAGSDDRVARLQSQQQQQQQLVLIESAKYGRMEPNSCAKPEYGIIGCGVDVLAIADWRCSGRARCKIKIPDDDMFAISNCPKESVSYLDVTYTCVNVASDIQSRCSSPAANPIRLTEETGYITSPIAPNVNYAYQTSLQSCSWQIRVEVGQRINLTLLDFGRSPRTSRNQDSPNVDHSTNGCYRKYATVTEITIASHPASRSRSDAGLHSKSQPKSADICGGASRDTARERLVYSSESNAVDVETYFVEHTVPSAAGNGRQEPHSGASEPKEQIRFLIRYDAVGCADMRPPEVPVTAIVRRDGPLSTVSCDNTTQSVRHHLVCKDRKWTGNPPLCPNSHQSAKTPPSPTGGDTADWWASYVTADWTYAILTTVGLGVALGVLVGVGLLLATLAYCKRRNQFGGTTMRMADKYISPSTMPPGSLTPGDYYERTSFQPLQHVTAGSTGQCSIGQTATVTTVLPSSECTSRLIPIRTAPSFSAATTAIELTGKEAIDFCQCACTPPPELTSLSAQYPSLTPGYSERPMQLQRAALFALPPPQHHGYDLTT